MPALENRLLGLHVSEDGRSVVVSDRLRNVRWNLDASTLTLRTGPQTEPQTLLPPGRACLHEGQIIVDHPAAAGAVRFVWGLEADHVRLRLETRAEVEAISLPGAFVPEQSRHEMLVPLYQGLLVKRSGNCWQRGCSHGGHFAFSLAMGAMLAERGALLIAHDSPANWRAQVGENRQGPFFYFEQVRCPVEGWVDASVRLYPADADVAAVAKRYRELVKARGGLVRWEEKIAAKPMLKELFGALIAFIGYNRNEQIDYVGGAGRLRKCGFERVLYYPVRLCHYSLNFQMGGDDPIWLSDEQVAAMRAVEGAHLSPWAWTAEALNNGSPQTRGIFRTDRQGGLLPNWRMDHFQWYLACTPYQQRHMRRRFASDMAAMDWVHFDVSAMVPGATCFSTEHELHGRAALSRRADLEWTRKLFSPETVGNRIVSSEGFADHYAPCYDIGSTKVMPPLNQDHPSAVPVPLTMLVFHDSCVHDWWELHNYNPHAFGLADLKEGLGSTGSGLPRLKAAMDALYGAPPNVFPFGQQYAWLNRETRQTYAFTVLLDDPRVQEALAAALPVARLHKRIGMCQMTGFEFLSSDRLVQASSFSDGTRIVANLSGRTAEADRRGTVEGHGWRQTDA